MRFYYLIAEKDTRRICVKYNAEWRIRMTDYLFDHGWKLRPTSEYHWNAKVDEQRHALKCYLLDDKVEVFDPEKY